MEEKQLGKGLTMFKLTFVVLLIATIVWGIVFYWSLQDYYKYVEECGEWAIPKPYFAWGNAIYIIISGVALLCAWVVFGVYLWNYRRGSERGDVATTEKRTY